MTTTTLALGRDFDIGVGAIIQTFNGSGITGKNISLQNCEGVGVLVVKMANGTTDDIAIDLQEVNGYAGTPRDLDILTDYWVKGETTLDNDEAWVKTTQTAASEITAIAGTAEKELLLYFEVRASQLSDGYSHIAVNVPDLGNTDTEQGCVLYIPFGLKVQRIPSNMPSLLRPGVANA
jgi:hypothetical protein